PATSAQIDTEAIDRLRTVLSKANRQLRLTYSDAEMSPSQREVFTAIVRDGPLRLSELAANEAINTTMLSRIVAKLEERELIQRRLDVHDGRVVHLSASPRGVALHATMRLERTIALGEAVSQLSASQQRALLLAVPALEEVVEFLRGSAR
ncbi:MAG: MarR family transcriptional regulator, partial [Acidimicrobiaceae bacterium]|nr:MarR family transcriptional regulator [Acidimicrobiaceae bacterium]